MLKECKKRIARTSNSIKISWKIKTDFEDLPCSWQPEFEMSLKTIIINVVIIQNDSKKHHQKFPEWRTGPAKYQQLCKHLTGEVGIKDNRIRILQECKIFTIRSSCQPLNNICRKLSLAESYLQSRSLQTCYLPVWGEVWTWWTPGLHHGHLAWL